MHTRPTDDNSRDYFDHDAYDNEFDDLIDRAIEYYNSSRGDHDYSVG
jgi:hypothetical protein